jgi:hypothetical protein
MCNGSTGDCDETVAPVGTPCEMAGSCTQNAVCDATGNCGGDPVPDGSPCEKDGCSPAATCVSGQCLCLGTPDLGDDPQPILSPDDVDMAAPGNVAARGCAISGSASSGATSALPGLLLLMASLGGLGLRRRAAGV